MHALEHLGELVAVAARDWRSSACSMVISSTSICSCTLAQRERCRPSSSICWSSSRCTRSSRAGNLGLAPLVAERHADQRDRREQRIDRIVGERAAQLQRLDLRRRATA